MPELAQAVPPRLSRHVIEEWVPGQRFVDVQLRGPYATWIHCHTFASKKGGSG